MTRPTGFGGSIGRVLRLARLARPSKRAILLLSLLAIAQAAGWLLIPWLIGQTFDRVLLERARPAFERTVPLVVTSGVILASALLVWVLEVVSTVGAATFDEKIIIELRRRIFWQLQRLSRSSYDRVPRGVLDSRLLDDTEALRCLARSCLASLVVAPLSLAAVVVLLTRLSPDLVLAASLPLAFGLPLVLVYARRARAASQSECQAVERLRAHSAEKIGGMRTVQLHSQEEREAARFDEHEAERRQTRVAVVEAWAAFDPTVRFLAAASLALTLLYGGQLLFEGILTPGELFTFIAYLVFLPGALRGWSHAQQNLQSISVSADRIFEILDVVPDVADRVGAKNLEYPPSVLGLREVVFGYLPAGLSAGASAKAEASAKAGADGADILQGASLEARAGDRISILGAAGCGKSTLASLLVRFCEPRGGSIQLDIWDIRDLTLRSLRSAVSLVTEEDALFSGTLRSNLTYGAPKSSPKQIEEALRVVCLEDFVKKLPRGLDSPLGEGATMLSSGERQRLCLARAILREPRILVLDDATSALDLETERKVLENLFRSMPKSIILVLSRRPAAVDRCDAVYEFVEGKLVVRSDRRTSRAMNVRFV